MTPFESSLSVVLDRQFDHPEGLVWDGAHNRLLWVDIFAGTVVSYEPEAGVLEEWDVGRPVGCVAPRRSGGLVCGVREGFGDLSDDGQFVLVKQPLKDKPYLQMNDGAVDQRGRFWAGTTCLQPGTHSNEGALYRLDSYDEEPAAQLQGVNISNGIGWSPDGRRCYYIDTPTQRLDVFSFDPDDGLLGERSTLVEVGGVPDGLAVDADGCIWVAFCGQWEVRRFTPLGSLDRVVRLPGSHVTTCAFGGTGLSTLFVAVSARDLSEEELRSEKAGYIFALGAGVQGLPAFEFHA